MPEILLADCLSARMDDQMGDFFENKIDIYNNIPKTKTQLPEILLSDCLSARMDDQMGDFLENKIDIYNNIQKTKT